MALKGTPSERREQKSQRRRHNQAEFVRARAAKVIRESKGGHQQVVVACNAALATSKRIKNDARLDLAKALIETVERFDVAKNHKESS